MLDDLDVDAVATLMQDGFEPCAVVETSSGNFQAWLRNAAVFPKLLGTLAAQTLASRYSADPSADRPAAADIAFCVAAFASGMGEDSMVRALEDDYLSRDPSPSKRAAYIRRTVTKARDWVV